jgi:hypothetical protein
MKNINFTEDIILLQNENEYNECIDIVKHNNYPYVPFFITFVSGKSIVNNKKYTINLNPILCCFGENKSVLFANNYSNILEDNYIFDDLDKEYIDIIKHYSEAYNNYTCVTGNDERYETKREIINNNEEYNIVYKNYPTYDYSDIENVKWIKVDDELEKMKIYIEQLNCIGFNMNLMDFLTLDDYCMFTSNYKHNVFFCFEMNDSKFKFENKNKIITSKEDYNKIKEILNKLNFLEYIKSYIQNSKLSQNNFVQEQKYGTDDFGFITVYGILKI